MATKVKNRTKTEAKALEAAFHEVFFRVLGPKGLPGGNGEAFLKVLCTHWDKPASVIANELARITEPQERGRKSPPPKDESDILKALKVKRRPGETPLDALKRQFVQASQQDRLARAKADRKAGLLTYLDVAAPNTFNQPIEETREYPLESGQPERNNGPKPGIRPRKDEGILSNAHKELLACIESNPDIVPALLKHAKKLTTRPDWAKLASELDDDALAKRRAKRNDSQARWRERSRLGLTTKPG